MGVGKRETCDGAVYNGAVFEFNRHCLVVQLHQKPAHFPFQIRKKKKKERNYYERRKSKKPPKNGLKTTN